MKNKFLLVLVLSSTILFSCNDNVKTVKKVLDKSETSLFSNVDPKSNSRKTSAISLPIIFPSGDNNIVGRVLMAEGKAPKPTIIFLHGNPGFEKNEETGQILRRAGYNTVFFSYSGTWGNKGEFSYHKSIEDLESLVEYLDKNSKRLRIDSKKIYLCGFSMGADIALLSAHKIQNIKGVISIDVWNGYNELKHKSEKQITQYIKNLDVRPCINIRSGKFFVDDIMNDDDMDLKIHLNELSCPVLHIFSNSRDMKVFKEYSEGLKEQKFALLKASDHSFSNKRIALAKTIFNFIKQK
jgi:alpha/beta superfamily hydrolase